MSKLILNENNNREAQKEEIEVVPVINDEDSYMNKENNRSILRDKLNEN